MSGSSQPRSSTNAARSAARGMVDRVDGPSTAAPAPQDDGEEFPAGDRVDLRIAFRGASGARFSAYGTLVRVWWYHVGRESPTARSAGARPYASRAPETSVAFSAPAAPRGGRRAATSRRRSGSRLPGRDGSAPAPAYWIARKTVTERGTASESRLPGRARVGPVAGFSFGRRIKGRNRHLRRVQGAGCDRGPGRRDARPEVPESGLHDRRGMLPVQGVTRRRVVVGDAPLVARGPGGSPSGCGTLCGPRCATVGCSRGLGG